MLRHHLHRRVAVEDLLPREQVIADASERVEVDAGIDRVAHHHLGRHVPGRADDEPRLRGQGVIHAPIGDGLHETEVEDLDEVAHQAELAEVDVGGLDVAVDEAADVGLLE